MMKKIIFILVVFSFIFSQTGIITSKGFEGVGLWTKINRPFTENTSMSYDFQVDYYSAIGLEVSIGTLRKENQDPVNRVGLAYHLKLTHLGIMFKCSKNTFSDFSFSSNDIFYDDYSLTLYKTGRLNPFFELISHDYSPQYFQHENNYYIRIGGLGRYKRFLTFSCSLKLPIDHLLDINNGFIEADIGINISWFKRIIDNLDF